jgi:hypothetical protein
MYQKLDRLIALCIASGLKYAGSWDREPTARSSSASTRRQDRRSVLGIQRYRAGEKETESHDVIGNVCFTLATCTFYKLSLSSCLF